MTWLQIHEFLEIPSPDDPDAQERAEVALPYHLDRLVNGALEIATLAVAALFVPVLV